MRVLLLSMPDSFEHMPALAIRMPNGALASLAGNVDPHHQVAIADLILVAGAVSRARSSGCCASAQPDVVGLSVMTFQRRTAQRIVRAGPRRRAGRPRRRRRLRSEPGARGLRTRSRPASTSSSGAKAS